ncbi:hypothetical protein SALBM135S_01616 [Streptomyces alboniger]
MPRTTSTRPVADRTAPPVVEGAVRVGGQRAPRIFRLRKMINATTTAWNTKAARQLSAEVMSPPSSGPAAAPTPPIAMIAPKARARSASSVKRRVVRMYTGGMSRAVPTPSRTELPRMSTPSPGAAALSRAPTPYTASPTMRHRLRP